MMQCCGIGMMIGTLAVLLGHVLLVGLIVLVWVAIGRLGEAGGARSRR